MQHKLLAAIAGVACAATIAGCDQVWNAGSPNTPPVANPNITSGGGHIDETPEEKPITEIPPEIQDYFDRSVAERKNRQRLLRAEIGKLKTLRRRTRAEGEQQAIDAQIAEREAAIEKLKTSYPVPPLNLARLHDGIIGGIGRVYVVDVQEGSTGLVCQSTDLSREHVVVLKLLSFVNLKVGEERIFENAFEVTGEQKIKMAGGRERSVFVMKAFRDTQLQPYKPLYEKLHPQLAENEPNDPDMPSGDSSTTATTPDSEPNDSPSKSGSNVSDEDAAAGKLKLAKVFVEKGNKTVAKKRLQAIVDDYPETEAAKEAKTILDGLE